MSSYSTQIATSSKRQLKPQKDAIELNTNISSKHRTSSTFKHIFSVNSFKKKKRHSNSTKSKLNELFKSTNHCKSPSISTHTNQIILWKPSLQIIYKDDLLLNTLTKYMEKSYNVENILFLLNIKSFKSCITNLESQIISIYNLYINPNAKHQINLSYHCFVNILSIRGKFNSFDIKQKHSMFDLCVKEIEHLMMTSILPSFYRNSSFQSIATKSKYYNVVENSNKTKNSTEYNYNPELFVQPMLVRNRRPSISCALYNSTTEVSKEIYED